MLSFTYIYISVFLSVPGERIPKERVWAPWLSSERYSTREHGGRYLCQRGWEQRRLHLLQRVHLQTRWTLKFLSVLPWLKFFGVWVSCKHSLWLPDHVLVLKRNVWVCEVFDVWSLCVWVGLPGRIRPYFKQMFFSCAGILRSLSLHLFAKYNYSDPLFFCHIDFIYCYTVCKCVNSLWKKIIWQVNGSQAVTVLSIVLEALKRKCAHSE